MGKKETNISPQFSLLDSTDVKLLRIARNAFKAEGSVVKNPPADAGDASSIPGQEDPLEKEVATHSSILAWEIPWTEEPGRLQPMGSTKSLT